MLKSWKEDVRSGIVVFLVALPLCLGIALASEAPIMSGVIAGAVGGIVIGLLGGSQLGVSGPAAGLVSIMIAAKAQMGAFETILLAGVLAGVIQLILSAARLGVIAYYFPSSVIKGMLAAIGLTIIFKELPHGVGYDKDYLGDMDFIQKDGHTTFSELYYMLDGILPGAVVITVACLAILLLWEVPALKNKQFFKVVPGPLVAVMAGIGLQLLYTYVFPDMVLSSEHLVQIDNKDMGSWFAFPDFTQIGNAKVWGLAVTIAGVASVESLLCAEATDKMDPEKRITPMNKELMAQGAGNVVSGLIGGLPITQVVVRSSANIQAGARSRLSAIIHGLLITLAVVALPGLLNLIPYAALAAILFVVGFKLARPALFKLMWKKGLAQFIPFVVTIVAILGTNLLVGIGIGMVIGIITILYNNFRIPYFFSTKVLADGRREVRIELSEVVSFLNKGNILTTLRMVPPGTRVVIDTTRSVSIDYDVEEVIDDFIKTAQRNGIEVVCIRHGNTTTQPFESARTVKEQLRDLSTID